MFQGSHIMYQKLTLTKFLIFFSKVVIQTAKIYKSVIAQVVTKTFGTQKKTEKLRSTIHMRLAYLKMLSNHQMVDLVRYLFSFIL